MATNNPFSQFAGMVGNLGVSDFFLSTGSSGGSATGPHGKGKGRHKPTHTTMRIHKKFQDSTRIDGVHANMLINQAHGGDERLFHLVGGALLRSMFERIGINIETHDQAINRGMDPRGGPTLINLYFRHKSNVDGTVEGTGAPNDTTGTGAASQDHEVKLRWNGSAQTNSFSDPFRPFDNIAMDVGIILYNQAKDYSRICHHVRFVTHSDAANDYGVTDMKDVAQSQLNIYVGRVLKMRNVTQSDEGNHDVHQMDANPIEGERVTFTGPAPRWRADLFSAMVNGDAGDEGRLGAISDERVANGINIPATIGPFVNPQGADNVGENGSGGGLLYKPRYKDLFTNVRKVQKVNLDPGQSKFMPTKFYFNGTLETFMAQFLSHYFPIGIGYSDMLLWRQSFPGHGTIGEANVGHERVCLEYVANTNMSASLLLRGPKRLPSQTVYNPMAFVNQ